MPRTPFYDMENFFAGGCYCGNKVFREEVFKYAMDHVNVHCVFRLNEGARRRRKRRRPSVAEERCWSGGPQELALFPKGNVEHCWTEIPVPLQVAGGLCWEASFNNLIDQEAFPLIDAAMGSPGSRLRMQQVRDAKVSDHPLGLYFVRKVKCGPQRVVWDLLDMDKMYIISVISPSEAGLSTP